MNFLTHDILLRDQPFFDFVLADETYEINESGWPQDEKLAPFRFLRIGEGIMDLFCSIFRFNHNFNVYGTSSFSGADLLLLIANIDEQSSFLMMLDQLQFMTRYGDQLVYFYNLNPVNGRFEEWGSLRDDLIALLGIIRRHAHSALKSAKTLAIVGIEQ